jgi:hypothetical protein
MVRKLRNGVGAVARVKKKFLHPAKDISDRYMNQDHNEELDGLLVLRKEQKRVNTREQTCVVFRHEDFDKEIYCVERWCKIVTEGPEESLFDNPRVDEEAPVVHDEPGVSVPVRTLGAEIREDIARFRSEGYDVDDDNDPAPENVPVPPPAAGQVQQQDSSLFGEWGATTLCHRRAEDRRFENPKLLKTRPDSRLGWLLYFLPMKYITTVLLVESSKVLPGKPLTLGEFIRFVGLWLIMATTAGNNRTSFFEQTEPSAWEGAPFRLNEFMSKKRFDDIVQSLRFTHVEPPPYRDKFHQIRQMIAMWNTHMMDVFVASWVSCLDESMSVWTRKWTCPGFMFVPRKPHPMGNEYHSICCGLSGIMYAIELVEGKDHPKERPKADYDDKGKTAGLLLRLCKSLFGTGKVVILDSGFCVLQAIIELKKLGVYASALIKKRRYWPKYIKGDEIKEAFADKEIGYQDRLPGELDGTKFDLFCMKEADYVMMLMSTYGQLIPKTDQKDSWREVDQPDGERSTKRFKYTEVFANHYDYRGAVDDHNNKRHDVGGLGVSLEDTWRTSRWEIRVFTFVCMAIVEVNAYLGRSFFGEETETMLEFRRKLAYECVYNTIDDVGGVGEARQGRPRRYQTEHKLENAPCYSKWVNGKWKQVYQLKYQQNCCSHRKCRKKVRTVCVCDRTKWICTECYALHLTESVIAQDS